MLALTLRGQYRHSHHDGLFCRCWPGDSKRDAGWMPDEYPPDVEGVAVTANRQAYPTRRGRRVVAERVAQASRGGAYHADGPVRPCAGRHGKGGLPGEVPVSAHILNGQGIVGIGVADEAVDAVDEACRRRVYSLLTGRIMAGKHVQGVGVECPGRASARAPAEAQAYDNRQKGCLAAGMAMAPDSHVFMIQRLMESGNSSLAPRAHRIAGHHRSA